MDARKPFYKLNRKIMNVCAQYGWYKLCKEKYIKQKKAKAESISNELWYEIKSYWSDYYNFDRLLYHYFGGVRQWYEAYNVNCIDKENLKYYIPEIIYYPQIICRLTNPYYTEIFDDKNLYDMYFSDIPMPKTILRKIRGKWMDAGYCMLKNDEVLSLLKNQGGIVCKQSVSSAGGKGVVFFDFEKEGVDDCLKWMAGRNNIVVQEVIRQHPVLDKIHGNSINTIRIMTLIQEGSVSVVSCVLRMGIGESKVDNASSGGIVVGLNENGQLKDYAYDVYLNKYECHPSTGFTFKDTIIPGFDICKEMAVSLAPRFLRITRLISWDFSISNDGTPVLIETNLGGSQLDFHQLCNGPLFGDRVKDVLEFMKKRNI